MNPNEEAKKEAMNDPGFEERLNAEIRAIGFDPETCGERVREAARNALAQAEVNEEVNREKIESMGDLGQELAEKVRRERMARTMLEAKAGLKTGWPHEHFPARTALPPTWEEVESTPDHKAWAIYEEVKVKQKKGPNKGKVTVEKVKRLYATLGGSVERDGKKWLHAAVSGPEGYPAWLGIKMVKTYLLGPEAWAYMVMPPDTGSEFSSAGTVMHFYHCLDAEKGHGQVLPDFTGGTGIV